MKTADDHWNAGSAQRLCDMQRAWILVRLHSNQADKAEIIVRTHVADDAVKANEGISFVDGNNIDIDIGTENSTTRTIVNEPVDAGQRVRRHRRAVPANDITVVIVMRRFNQYDAETLMCAGHPSRMPKRQHTLPNRHQRHRSPFSPAKPTILRRSDVCQLNFLGRGWGSTIDCVPSAN